MNLQPQQAERRAHPRFPISLPVHTGDGALTTEDISIGGACVKGSGAAVEVGQHVEVEIPLPGNAAPLRTKAEVRWQRGDRFGLSFGKAARTAVAAFLATFVGLSATTVEANNQIPTFDPHADQSLDGYGGERPDEQLIMSAFEQTYEQIDVCVGEQRRGDDDVVNGSADVSILLNPAGDRPLGVNAEVDGPLASNKKLVDCLRQATGKAPYPAYDGPPVVVTMNFNLDPGYDMVEE